ncbi:uncharacterized protein LOC123537401 isoform X2 [Mercenaria mercenaria]|uniref:uncharacterized protein LOC123537401 isoform X2 n=1 Tax=Mercenaria mercenaria TaxID=6596 RepID=UPI001E1DC08F|nr:uncharacterized protein LOC123537401 isoform X2 [Mercenaria mercenaria]
MCCNNTFGVIFKMFIVGAVVTVLCDGQLDIHKRLPNVLHQLALKKLSGTYFNKALQRSLAKARERRGHLSDAGYGSRVSAGSNIASAVMARQGLFGITGPGRRKRRNSARESNGINTQMFLQYTQNTF